MFIKNNEVILAPMAGISDSVFRRLCRDCGADRVYSEMVSAEGLVHNSGTTIDLLRFTKRERPVGIQIFGADPDHCARAAVYIQENFNPDFIDLNSGCPVPKVVKKNGGASLLRDIKLFSDILKAVVNAVSLPVTVKIRSGWHKNQWVDVDFAKEAESCGVSAITLHPRSQSMGFSGHSFWDRIALVKQSVSIPVIGNGDITNENEALKMFSQTGCDAVMIGRGAYGNPWIFRRIKQALKKEAISNVDSQELLSMVLKHIKMFRDESGETRAYSEMKKHCAWYLRGLPGVSALRNKIFRSESTSELIDLMTNYFETVTTITNFSEKIER